MGGLRRQGALTAAKAVPAAPDIDENAVDRARIRAMLALPPAERLLVIQNLAEPIGENRTRPTVTTRAASGGASITS